MAAKMQNPGVQTGASRNQLGGWLHSPPTALERQAQLMASRFCISPAMAKDIARLCFGEALND
ncbi:MAG: hypothetical protein C0429_15215 [Sphingopyxis sp.]|nr:hypothetical protein [Sphingopyxis sp.]